VLRESGAISKSQTREIEKNAGDFRKECRVMSRRSRRQRRALVQQQTIKRMSRAQKRRVLPEDGIPCPRCGTTTEAREHTVITAKMLRQPFYYRRWYRCINPRCKTTMVMRDEDRIYIEHEIDEATETRLSAIKQQLGAA
jgi:hypothetical protein